MAVVNTPVLALAMVMVAMPTLMLAYFGVAEIACGGDMVTLRKQCEQFVRKDGKIMDPSKECCTEVIKFDFTCICKNLTPEKEKLYSPEKMVHVARFCGLKVQPGLKCGSKFFSFL